MQFVRSGKGQAFVVETILGGTRAHEVLAKKGISAGRTISLEGVAPSQSLTMASQEPVVITTDDGLHLHLRPGQAGRILVTQADS